MISTDKVIVVEGKYDKIRLENIIDATIIPTDGFGIFKNKELLRLLKKLADQKGLIILTDSDAAGFMIRSHISGAIPNDKITHIYVPELFGKEKRKEKPSAEGLLGVEGIDDSIILSAFEKAGIGAKPKKDEEKRRLITKLDLYKMGFYGKENSAYLRQELLSRLGLPKRISSNRLPEVLNLIYSYDEFLAVAKEVI